VKLELSSVAPRFLTVKDEDNAAAAGFCIVKLLDSSWVLVL
jgi:hypothetical protein